MNTAAGKVCRPRFEQAIENQACGQFAAWLEKKNGESAGITGIPTDAVTYTVTEPDDLGEGWTKGSIENAQGTASGQTVTVNNSYYKVQESEVKVTKSWHGTGSVMPDSVTVQLYRNGELTVQPSS